jgi:integrase/recombinase XerD
MPSKSHVTRVLLASKDSINIAKGKSLSLRVSEACSARLSNIKWSHGRWVLTLKVKRGREEKWPIPLDVKQAIDDYLKLDNKRRAVLLVDGPEAYIFQPHTNYRTLEFAKGLSSRQAHKIIKRWGEYTGLGKVSPHDLRRTVITKLLNDGRSYREVQMVTKRRDPRSVQRYDHGRENLESNPVNTLSYNDDKPSPIKGCHLVAINGTGTVEAT